MAAELHFAEVLANGPILLRGLGLTLALWAIAFAAGITISLPLAFARDSRLRLLRWPARLFVEIFRNTPVLVQVIWFYYGLAVLTGIQLPAFAAAALSLGLNATAYCTEIHRGGLRGVGRGQWEAGRALGMSRGRLLWRIILPQAIRRMIPAFTNRAVELAKNTSIASVIAVHELMYQARLLANDSYLPLETFTVVAVIYFILIYPVTLAAAGLERHLARGRH